MAGWQAGHTSWLDHTAADSAAHSALFIPLLQTQCCYLCCPVGFVRPPPPAPLKHSAQWTPPSSCVRCWMAGLLLSRQEATTAEIARQRQRDRRRRMCARTRLNCSRSASRCVCAVPTGAALLSAKLNQLPAQPPAQLLARPPRVCPASCVCTAPAGVCTAPESLALVVVGQQELACVRTGQDKARKHCVGTAHGSLTH